jgi:dihydropteroate synthase
LKRENPVPAATHCLNTVFNWGERTYIMGVMNLSPDSFSGDGLANIEAARAQAKRFISEGADIIDIGGESTRPDFQPVTIDEELRRVIPIIEILAGEIDIPISIDTYKSAVASRAVEAGASIINDVWGLQKSPELVQIAADYKIPIIITSNQRDKPCRDIMPCIISDLDEKIRLAENGGVGANNIIIDPGIGFGKTLEQNLEIIRRLAELKPLGKPVLLGTSRKSLIGGILRLPVDRRLEGTAATVAIGIANGADIIRVHDVEQMVRVCRMSDAIIRRKE